MRNSQKLYKGQVADLKLSSAGGYVHLSLLVSISPNNSLLPPLRDVAAEVADAAAEVAENATEGLLARTCPEVESCWRFIMKIGSHWYLIATKVMY